MDAKTTYTIYNSAFHGGRCEGAHYSAPGYLISRHRSEQAAIRKYRSWTKSHGDCQCGAPILIVEITGGGLGGVERRRGHVYGDRIALH